MLRVMDVAASQKWQVDLTVRRRHFTRRRAGLHWATVVIIYDLTSKNISTEQYFVMFLVIVPV